MIEKRRFSLQKLLNTASNWLKALYELLRSYFITGVILIVPTVVTLFIIYQFFMFADGFLGNAVSSRIGKRIPGFGLISTILLFIIAGMVAQNMIGKQILKWIDKTMARMPIVRSLYSSIKQVSDVLFQPQRTAFKRVVLVEYPTENSWTLAFVTGEFQINTYPSFATTEMLYVYVPTTPNPTSGFLLVVDRANIREVSINIEDAMKLIISGGIVQPTPITKITATRLADVEDFTIPH